MEKVTFETISTKAKEYKMEIVFVVVIVIFAALAKTLCNFFLDYRIVIIIIAILWYLGYMNKIQKKFYEKLSLINYFKAKE